MILGDFNINEKDKFKLGRFKLVEEAFLNIGILQVKYETPNLNSLHSHMASSTPDHVWCKNIDVSAKIAEDFSMSDQCLIEVLINIGNHKEAKNNTRI